MIEDDPRREWIHNILSSDEVAELLDSADKVLFYENQAIELNMSLSFNDCFNWITLWNKVNDGDDEAWNELDQMIEGFVVWILDCLEQMGISYDDE